MATGPGSAPSRMNAIVRSGFAMALVVAGTMLRAGDAERAKASQVKAAYLYNFTKFVEWPAERIAIAGAEGAFVIGVSAHDEICADLRRTLRGRRCNGRPIEIKEVRTSADVVDVHLLFLGHAGDAVLREACRRPGVLVVGEGQEMLERGGAIAFLVVGDNLRFAINVEAATRAGLKISAQLQKLAVNTPKTP